MNIFVSLILDVTVFFCIYLVFSISLNLQHGYSGIANLGLYFPIIIGAMVVGYVPGRLAMLIYNLGGLDFVENNSTVLSLLKVRLENDPLTSIMLLAVTIVLAMGIGSATGYLAAYPALRLPLTYLAVFYLSLGETLRVIGMSTMSIAGGTLGVNTINPFWWLHDNAGLAVTVFIVGVTAVLFIWLDSICRSPVGRLMRSIRENELTAATSGKNVPEIKKKVLAFTFSILALGGVLHAYLMGGVLIGGFTRADFTFWPWLMMIVGGTGNNKGVFVGTFAIVIMRRAMTILKNYFGFLPFSVLWFEPILMGIMLGLTIAYRPGGLIPEQPSKI
jgi:branched-chain amino acid transport system permease protein